LVFTAPQSLGPGNRRGSAAVGVVVGLFLAVVAFTTYGATRTRENAVNFDVATSLGLDKDAPGHAVVLLSGTDVPPTRRVLRMPIIPTSTAGDCLHPGLGEDRQLPAATRGNVQKLTAWLDAHGNEVSGPAIRVASCRAALQGLLWDPAAAREGIFLSARPERIGALSYYLTAPNVGSADPARLTRILHAMSDTARYVHGGDAARRFADLARVAGDTALEAAWRQRIIQPSGSAAMAALIARPAYTDGGISGRVQSSKAGWRVGLLAAPDPTSGADPSLNAPRDESQVLSAMITAADVGADGRFSFTGLRDGYYQLALMAPEGSKPQAMTHLALHGDPGVIRLEPAHKQKDVGVIAVDY
jgi:hypothetical protein